MTDILVTGASGLLGGNAVEALSRRNGSDVLGTYFKNPVSFDLADTAQVDLSDPGQYDQLRSAAPSTILHCAALTDVDRCERQPEEARRHNIEAAIRVAELAEDCGAYLVHVSTDSVFDGREGWYEEDDEPNPVNLYSETKLESERRVRELYDDVCVVRTNIYGWNKLDKQSLAEWMLKKLQSNEELPGFHDVYFTPILVNDLIDVVMELVDRHHRGLLHVAGSERLSKLDFGRVIADVFGHSSDDIVKASVEEMDFDAERPRDTSLCVDGVESIIGHEMPSVRDGLKRMRNLGEAGFMEVSP